MGAAIVGIGESPYCRAGHATHSAMQLASTAIERAADDAGLRLDEIDGLVTWGDRVDPARLASLLGFGDLSLSARPWGGGGNLLGMAVGLAEAAVRSGQARAVAVYRSLSHGGSAHYGQTASTREAGGEQAYLAPFGASTPVIRNALLASRYMDDFDISPRAFAEISLAAYHHAQHNPRAVMYGRPLTLEDYFESRWIAEPLRLYDCCQVSDGAAAIIVVDSDRAQSLPAVPAHILAATSGMHRSGGEWAFNDDAFAHGRCERMAASLWERAGCTPADVQVAQFYENFTSTTLMAIADMGFARHDSVERFVADGALMWPDGILPTNTSGGNLAEAYVHGLQLVNEAVRQVRGESTCQVEDVELSLVVGGPGTSPSSALLLGRSE